MYAESGGLEIRILNGSGQAWISQAQPRAGPADYALLLLARRYLVWPRPDGSGGAGLRLRRKLRSREVGNVDPPAGGGFSLKPELHRPIWEQGARFRRFLHRRWSGEVAAARLRELQRVAARVRSGTAQEAGGDKAGGRLNADRAVAAVVFSNFSCSFSLDAAQSITVVVAAITAAVTTASTTVGDRFASDRDAA
jgi:hypothetical protein